MSSIQTIRGPCRYFPTSLVHAYRSAKQSIPMYADAATSARCRKDCREPSPYPYGEVSGSDPHWPGYAYDDKAREHATRRQTNKRVAMLTVALSILGTLVVVLVVRNFRKPEKEPHHRVKRSYDINSPQLKREMGALLGPTIVPGNCVQALENGDEIFPSMLAAIGAAKRCLSTSCSTGSAAARCRPAS